MMPTSDQILGSLHVYAMYADGTAKNSRWALWDTLDSRVGSRSQPEAGARLDARVTYSGRNSTRSICPRVATRVENSANRTQPMCQQKPVIFEPKMVDLELV